jgi:hypothetical protein
MGVISVVSEVGRLVPRILTGTSEIRSPEPSPVPPGPLIAWFAELCVALGAPWPQVCDGQAGAL